LGKAFTEARRTCVVLAVERTATLFLNCMW